LPHLAFPLHSFPGSSQRRKQAYAKAGFVPQGRDGVAEVHGDDWDVGFTVGVIFEYLKGNEIYRVCKKDESDLAIDPASNMIFAAAPNSAECR